LLRSECRAIKLAQLQNSCREKRTEPSIKRAIAAIGVRVAQKLKSTKSPKGSGVESWLERTLWEVQHSEDALIAKSCGSLAKALEELGYPLLVADRDGIYDELLKTREVYCRYLLSRRPEGEGPNKATSRRSGCNGGSKREKWPTRNDPAPRKAECGRIDDPTGLRGKLPPDLFAQVAEGRLHTSRPFGCFGSSGPGCATWPFPLFAIRSVDV
jgi:hypothetical protein